jgi:hypothetical protein
MADEIYLSPTYVSAVEVGDKAVTQEFLNSVIGYFRKLGVPAKEVLKIYGTGGREMLESDRKRRNVDVKSLDPASKVAVASFARRLSDIKDQEKRDEFVRQVLGETVK